MNKTLIQKWMSMEATKIVVRIPRNINDADEVRLFIEAVKKFIAETGVSQQALATEIGVSGTALSQFLAGKYPGKTESVIKGLGEFINRSCRRARRSKEPDYVETTVAKRILAAIRVTEQFTTAREGRICLIVGDSGHGKTKCLEQYAAVNPLARYVKLCDKMSAAAMMSRIAAAMKLDAGGGLKTLVDELTIHLSNRELTIILDEAAGLDVGRLNLLRQVIVESGCTLILAGNTHLLKTISEPTGKRGNECLDQFRSRMLTSLNLDEMAQQSPRDGGLYSVEDIRRLYAEGGIRLTKDAEGLLLSIAKCPETGRLRTCSVVVASINTSRQARDGRIAEISDTLIIDTISQLGLPVGPYLPMAIEAARKEQSQQVRSQTA